MLVGQKTCLLLALSVLCAVSASSGDRAPDFVRCLVKCSEHTCARYEPPLALQLTRWTCTDDCKYRCMHAATDHAIESSLPIEQYYGKWPFWRFAGMQEPASVIFSLANLLLHIWGLGEVKKDIPNVHPMKRFYVRWAYISCNAWIWSAIFHTRDTPFTEKLDYFSAGLSILYSLYMSVVRLFHLYATPFRPAPRTFYIWSSLCVLAYLSHISYLSLSSRFDYTYNIAANVVLGLTHNALWLTFSMPASMSPLRRFLNRPRQYRPWYATRAAQAVVLTTLATMLELFDFPPWRRIVDAHSLWHLATAPLAVLWYDFLINDATDAGWKHFKSLGSAPYIVSS